MTTLPAPAPAGQRRTISPLFFLGLMLFPWLFCWFLLQRGYSPLARVLAFGWGGLLLLPLVSGLGSSSPSNTTAAAPAEAAQEANDDAVKAQAAALARTYVASAMRDPASAQFGDVWGVAPMTACGFVNGKNAFGAMAGEQRFIFALGSVAFQDGSARFVRRWNALCVARNASAPPAGFLGKPWGSHPTADLKPAMDATPDGLDVYTPKRPPAPFEGVPIKEEDFEYAHHRLYGGDLYVDGDPNREAIKAALIKRFGKPIASDDDAHDYTWRWPSQKVKIHMYYQPTFARTTVNFDRGSS